EDGGQALSGIIAKGGSGREQSLHDNLLGNLTHASVTDRDFDPAVESDFLARIPDDIEGRPWVSGYASDTGGANHDEARAFDYDKGWYRTDWVDLSFGSVDETGWEDHATLDGQLHFGSSNVVTDFNIARHEGA